MSTIIKKGFRNVKTEVKTAFGRKISSTKWLKRHLNDPFVALAKQEGYRSRAAFKLMEIVKQNTEFKTAQNIIDVGCAPGGWLQVLKQNTKAHIYGVDLQTIEDVDGVKFFQGDFQDNKFFDYLSEELKDLKFDAILSDMAASSSGDRETDHLRSVALVEMVVEFVKTHLAEGGLMLAKLMKGREEQKLVDQLRSMFTSIKRVKPEASYDDSPEFYILCKGYKSL